MKGSGYGKGFALFHFVLVLTDESNLEYSIRSHNSILNYYYNM